jgi:hypothetical protein
MFQVKFTSSFELNLITFILYLYFILLNKKLFENVIDIVFYIFFNILN